MSVASTADVAVPLLRPLTTAETAYAARLLDWAELLIKARYPDLEGVDINAAVMVEAQAVARVLRNPEGKVQESLAGEYQATRNTLSADGQLRITDEEWALLTPSTAGAETGAFSIDTAPSLGGYHPAGCSWWFSGFCTCGLVSA